MTGIKSGCYHESRNVQFHVQWTEVLCTQDHSQGQSGKADHHPLDVESGLSNIMCLYLSCVYPSYRYNKLLHFYAAWYKYAFESQAIFVFIIYLDGICSEEIGNDKLRSFAWWQDSNIRILLERNTSVQKGPPFVHNTIQINKAHIFTRFHKRSQCYVCVCFSLRVFPLSALESEDLVSQNFVWTLCD
jgi:hypothetical protein